MRKFSSLLKIVIVALFFLFFAKETWALRFDLIAPTEVLQRGQIVTFTINVDTQGKKLSTTQIGLTYETEYLEFVNITPGDTFSTVTSSQVDKGKLLITATEQSGFSGQGMFAEAKFKLIATAPGTTELCALWVPDVTPTTVQPTNPPEPTTINATGVIPTKLPKSGSTQTAQFTVIFGVISILLSIASLFIFRK